MRGLLAALAASTTLTFAGLASACPVGLKVSVDNDSPGSGYSEVKPENWLGNNVAACKGTYRYLSHTVGDGTRKGKAIWQPKIATAGMYEVTTSFRATSNRTNDADYILYDDKSGSQKKSVDQTKGTDCTKVVIGTAYCAPGGSCRLVLDGDDGKSDSGDETVFVLKSCDATSDAGVPPGPCDGIAAVSAYEVCAQTATTCSGVYSNGAGCTAYCAAAGMVCTARFGAGNGCEKEAQNPFACNANNGHQSNWCECALPAGTGGTGGIGGGGGSGGAAGGGGASNGGSAGAAGSAGSAGSAGAGGSGAGWVGTGASVGKIDAGPDVTGGTTEDDAGSCGCRVGSRSQSELWATLLALGAAGLVFRRRRG
jgi:hypothetical protein